MVIVNNTINTLNIEENKFTIIASTISNKISTASIGIQGTSGNLQVTSEDNNKVLTNDGVSVKWSSSLDEIILNGGYF